MSTAQRKLLQSLLNTFYLQIPEDSVIDIQGIKKILYDYFDALENGIDIGFFDSFVRVWDQVIQKIRSVGSYDTVIFEDPLIPAVIQDMGGWV